jgi:hypothetical protein
MFQRHIILDVILFQKLQIIRGCVNHHPNGLLSASSSSDTRDPLFHQKRRRMWLAPQLQETMAPWGEEGSAMRGWGFLLVAIVGRGRGRCVRMRFLLVEEWGEEKRVLGGRGIFLTRGTHSTIIE